MIFSQVNSTRMELARQKKRLSTAVRGHKLLKDKRDELMRRFLELIREDQRLREKTEAGLLEAGRNFALAKAAVSEPAVNAALLLPKQKCLLEIKRKNLMNVEIPRYKLRNLAVSPGDIFCYGFACTSFELDKAVRGLSELLPDLLRLAETEKACELLAAEIERTRRRVNGLEHGVIPDAREKIRRISMKLEENERGARTRLMKVKDLSLKLKAPAHI